MNMSNVSTWTSGYGVWHARVPVGPHAAHIARHAIRKELAARDVVSKGPLYVTPSDDCDPVPGTIVYAAAIRR